MIHSVVTGTCSVCYAVMVRLWLFFIGLCASQDLHFKHDDEVCQLPDGRPGRCRKMHECMSAIDGLHELKIRPLICSYDRFTPIVCCDVKSQETENVITKSIVGSKAKTMCDTYTDFAKKNNKCVGLGSFHTAVFGGKPAKQGEFPHMALLGQSLRSSSIDWKCGGSLISDTFILTAAHCTRIADWALLGVDTISNLNDPNRLLIRVREKINHPKYKAPSGYHDIALLRLSKRVKLNTFARPACLSLEQEIPMHGECCTATGWGTTEEYVPSDSLLFVDLPVEEKEECELYYKADKHKMPHGMDHDIMFCAGFKQMGKDTCQGDSGGPLQQKIDLKLCSMYKIVGITSFGKSCGSVPGMYTKVAGYIEWIESIVWQD